MTESLHSKHGSVPILDKNVHMMAVIYKYKLTERMEKYRNDCWENFTVVCTGCVSCEINRKSYVKRAIT